MKVPLISIYPHPCYTTGYPKGVFCGILGKSVYHFPEMLFYFLEKK